MRLSRKQSCFGRKYHKILFFYLLSLVLIAMAFTSCIQSTLNSLSKKEGYDLIEADILLKGYLWTHDFNVNSLDINFVDKYLNKFESLMVEYKEKDSTIFYHKDPLIIKPSESHTDSFIRKIIYDNLPEKYKYIHSTDVYHNEPMYIDRIRNEHGLFASTTIKVENENFSGKITIYKNLTKSMVPAVKRVFYTTVATFLGILILYTYIYFKGYKLLFYPFEKANRSLDALLNDWDITHITALREEQGSLKEFSDKINKLILNSYKHHLFSIDFIEEVVHETKNPINNIINIAELIKDKDELSDKDLDIIINQAYTINSLLDGLRSAADIVLKQNSFHAEVVVIEKAVENILASITELHMSRNFNIRFNEMNVVVINKNLLSIIVQNIVGNAIKFSYKDSPIDIVIEKNSDGDIELRVTNKGPTIPYNIQDKIFEKHYRGKATEHTVPGSGLGLWIVKEILDKSIDGKVTVKSKNQVTTFTVIFKTHAFNEVEASKKIKKTMSDSEKILKKMMQRRE